MVYIFGLRKDHPHAYGDKLASPETSILLKGSSPRVWGQAGQMGDKGPQYRIIPTRMGTSGELPMSIIHRKDHPHAYGDKL